MTLRNFSIPLIVTLFSVVGIQSCNSSEVKNDKPSTDSLKQITKTKETKEPEKKYDRPPIVNLVDTLAPKRIIIYCSDSAASFDRISAKLATIYGTKLQAYIKKNNLKTAGAPMAWYKKEQAPWFFDAGLPVNKAGAKAVSGVRVKELPASKAIIAHFFGPYELLPQGYTVIKDFMKENKKVSAGSPYEIYVTDAIDKDGKAIDPYKVQTDIVFPIK